MFKRSFVFITIAVVVFGNVSFLGKLKDLFHLKHEKKTTPILPKSTGKVAADEIEYAVGGFGGQLTRFHLNGTGRPIGTEKEFANTSWVAPTQQGLIIANEYLGIISYVNIKGADKLHELQNLTRPIVVGEAFSKDGNAHWFAACHGDHNGKGSGIAVSAQRLNWTVFEHEVPAEFKPHHEGPVRRGQNFSKIEAVNTHAFRDDFVIALDAGFDHIYHYGIHEWQNGLQIVYTFERGFGPHSFDFDYRNHLMFVLGEYDVSFAVLQWDSLRLSFRELDRQQIIPPELEDWTGGDILLNREGEIFCSLRHFNGSGYIVKYFYDFRSKEFRQIGKTDVGEWPTRMALSEDQSRLLVANEFSESVQILSTHDLSEIAQFSTGKMHPIYIHELRNHHHNSRGRDILKGKK